MITQDEDRVPSVFTVPLTLVLVGLVLFMAFLNGQASLAILCLLVFLMAAGAGTWSRISISKLDYDVSFDRQRLFPSESLCLTVRFENRKFLPVWLRLTIGHAGSLTTTDGEKSLKKDCGLLWYQAVDFDWHLRAACRGVHRIGPLSLEVGDILGFYPKKKVLGKVHELLVYPRRVVLKPFCLPRRDFFGIPGARSPIEDPVYIHGTRDYSGRRPARFIHWKASARHNRLQEKVCEPAEQEKVLILVRTDGFGADRSGESFEHCLEAAAALAVSCDRLRYAVGLATNGRIVGEGRSVLPVSRNRNQLAGIMETLARLDALPQGKIPGILQKGLALPWGVTCVCFQFKPDDQSFELSQYFRQRQIPLVNIFCDPATDFSRVEAVEKDRMLRLSDLHPLKGPM